MPTKEMNSQCQRSALQLASTINGPAWYGDSLREILAGLTAEAARARPVGNGHSIWEIVAHLNAWIVLFSGAVHGTPIPPWPAMPKDVDWPPVTDETEQAWQECLRSCFDNHAAFVKQMHNFADERLQTTVPGRAYDFNQLFQSASLHAAYHAGQIALLKKMVTVRS
jgi:uncharacterized damage-inducible protein DinB